VVECSVEIRGEKNTLEFELIAPLIWKSGGIVRDMVFAHLCMALIFYRQVVFCNLKAG
jgi:hypothetical protein